MHFADRCKCAGYLVLLLALPGVAGAEEVHLACSPDRPVVSSAEPHASVQAWPDWLPSTFDWRVNVGTVRGEGRVVTWDLSGAPSGRQHATVTAIGNGRTSSCSLEVVTLFESVKKADATGGAYLLAGRPEDVGYGLYSYLLFGEKPEDDRTRARYAAALDAYVLAEPSIRALEDAGMVSRRLNITYVPVTKTPTRSDETASTLLTEYDFAGARAILSLLPGRYRGEGPYIISSLTPLSTAAGAPGKLLFQDLTIAPPELVKLWARAYLDQATQEQFWKPQTLETFALKVRLMLAVTADGYPTIAKDATDLIAVKTAKRE
jgi:hypothetical protein